jgi:hypothetical protein
MPVDLWGIRAIKPLPRYFLRCGDGRKACRGRVEGCSAFPKLVSLHELRLLQGSPDLVARIERFELEYFDFNSYIN